MHIYMSRYIHVFGRQKHGLKFLPWLSLCVCLHATNTNGYFVYQGITQLHISVTCCQKQKVSVICFNTCTVNLLLFLLLVIIKISISNIYETKSMHKLQTYITRQLYVSARLCHVFNTCIDLVVCMNVQKNAWKE